MHVAEAPVFRPRNRFSILTAEALDSALAEFPEFRVTGANRSVDPARKLIPLSEIPSTGRKLGQVLFGVLFPSGSELYETFGRSCEVAERQGAALRLKLEPADELANLPWELLTPPVDGGPWAEALQRVELSVVRLMGPMKSKPPAGTGQAAVLLVLADPYSRTRDQARDSLRREQGFLATWFRNLGVHVETAEGEHTLSRMKEACKRLSHSPWDHCGLHFVGHGGWDEHGGYLSGVGERSELDRHSEAPRIYQKDLLSSLEPLNRLDWAFFNSCHGGYQPIGSPLAGIATAVSKLEQVPVVLAYQQAVSTSAAEQVAQDFYRSTFQEGMSVETAVDRAQRKLQNPGGLVLMLQSPSSHRGSETFLRLGSAVSHLPSHNDFSSRFVLRPTVQSVPPSQPPLDMVAIPTGEIDLGRLEDNLRAAPGAGFDASIWNVFRCLVSPDGLQSLPVPGFQISRTAVTWRQFLYFVGETGYRPSSTRIAQWRELSPAELDHPVVQLTVTDAEAYCLWSKTRLPTLREWSRAYFGDCLTLYPWGDHFEQDRCHGADHDLKSTTVRAGELWKGSSEFGCVDLAGNVWEWSAEKGVLGSRLVLGGSFLTPCRIMGQPSYGRWALPTQAYPDVGFRVVASAP